MLWLKKGSSASDDDDDDVDLGQLAITALPAANVCLLVRTHTENCGYTKPCTEVDETAY
jgi:hypothetical protein